MYMAYEKEKAKLECMVSIFIAFVFGGIGCTLTVMSVFSCAKKINVGLHRENVEEK